MKKAHWISCSAIILLLAIGCSHTSSKARVLVFIDAPGAHLVSPPAGIQAILAMGKANNFDVDTTSSAAWFLEDSLKNYAAVLFLNTSGSQLNQYQRTDFERYIQAGGGYAGIHAAIEAKYDWGWYGRLVGDLHKKDSAGRGATGNAADSAWQHDFDGGRSWYSTLGSTDTSYTDSAWLQRLKGGIDYAIGGNKGLDYTRASSLRTPEEDRFTKQPLTTGEIFEPTEMTILPNLDILVAQRRGEIMLYSNSTKKIKQAGFLNVYWKTLHTPGVNAEEGLLGIQADPNFATNHFVYIYYSPTDTSVNRLSRFTLVNDSIDNHSEKIILQLYSQREICCHTGGSIAFGNDNMLFVSTGDNSTPFDEPKTSFPSHGYAPLDDRPGHLQYDARRGAGNTNDLRGKILRIQLKPDGTYDIPTGNLFPPGTAKTRPEIYVMGDRNPYRIAVDKKNGYLYWGEVGPDANQDSLDTRGPRGYDEVNQARKAGFFGWPYFVGDNYPYHLHDYATDANGSAFDPARPVNGSRNNTGLRELPPVAPAFIWYPYAASPDFPEVGSGGRCAMAGPVFHSDLYPEKTRLPDYYNGKFIMYDFTRCWFKAVTMLPNGDFDRMEPFMEHSKFNSPIDAEMGPDGRLYILEYGSGWFSKNADAGIFRVDYNGGNRPPKLGDLTIDKTSGDLPLKIVASIDAKDPEKDKLTYTWRIGNDSARVTTEPKLEYTLTTAGDYPITVIVKDDKGDSSTSKSVSVYAGNEAPTVTIALKGNKTFYFPGTPVGYQVGIEDKDDTAQQKDKNDLIVSADYMEGSDKAAAPQGHQTLSGAAMGKNLVLSLDCKTCHKTEEKSIGPAFRDVAIKYEKDPDMVSYLVQKITKGGSGKWGETVMPAHPALKEDDIKDIIGWIQTLSGANKTTRSLPAAGTLKPTLDKPEKDKGILTITASFTDKGGNNIKPLTGNSSVTLRNSKIKFERDSAKQASLHTDSIDLSTIRSASLQLGWMKGGVQACTFELRLDGPSGEKLGSFTFKGNPAGPVAPPKQPFTELLHGPLQEVKDGRLHRIFITRDPAKAGGERLVVATLQLSDK